MIDFLKNLFHNPDAGNAAVIIKGDETRFILKIGKLIIGYLSIENKEWVFYYSEEFKKQDKYYRLVGFPDMSKKYRSDILWPFFKIRIPGLGQPMVQEILQKENIDKNNEAALLRRFGQRSISNPYILENA